MQTKEKILRPEIARYTCDCSQVGGPYEWVKVGQGQYTCPYCGKTLKRDEIIHKQATYILDEEGGIVI